MATKHVIPKALGAAAQPPTLDPGEADHAEETNLKHQVKHRFQASTPGARARLCGHRFDTARTILWPGKSLRHLGRSSAAQDPAHRGDPPPPSRFQEEWLRLVHPLLPLPHGLRGVREQGLPKGFVNASHGFAPDNPRGREPVPKRARQPPRALAPAGHLTGPQCARPDPGGVDIAVRCFPNVWVGPL